MMLIEGQLVYFLINGYVLSGKVINIEKDGDDYSFSIEGYAGCAGLHIISSRELHLRVFLSEEEAQMNKDLPQMYLSTYC